MGADSIDFKLEIEPVLVQRVESLKAPRLHGLGLRHHNRMCSIIENFLLEI
jgi:hypothetical protein